MFKKIISIVSLTAFLLVLSVATIASAQNPQPPPPPPPSGLINPLCPAGNPNCANSDAEGPLEFYRKLALDNRDSDCGRNDNFRRLPDDFRRRQPEKFKNGKMTILYTAIGYGIILIGEGITLIIKDILK